jgi:hypothetical protein
MLTSSNKYYDKTFILSLISILYSYHMYLNSYYDNFYINHNIYFWFSYDTFYILNNVIQCRHIRCIFYIIHSETFMDFLDSTFGIFHKILDYLNLLNDNFYIYRGIKKIFSWNIRSINTKHYLSQKFYFENRCIPRLHI